MKQYASVVLLMIPLVVLVGCGGQEKASMHKTPDVAQVAKVLENPQNRKAVMAFYEKALTANTQTNPGEALTAILAEGYESTGSAGSKNSEQLIGQLGAFWKMIPDLKWEVQDVVNNGDTYVVRSIATGTPNGDFMGIPTDGSKSFKIMTIDTHVVKDGKIMNSHHVEDWATAMQQLKSASANTPKKAEESNAMDIANAFMGAMGTGDMETMIGLMHDDMVWQNAGDAALPWIGPWEGKKAILEEFMPAFGEGFKTIKWEPSDALSQGDTAAYFGQMIGELTHSGEQTKEFTYALRVKVKDDKIILWNWFEDSFEVSRAYNK